MYFVNCLLIIGAARTCSTLQPSRNCEYGLFTECLWFLLAETSAYNPVPGEVRVTLLTDLCKVFDVGAILVKVLLRAVREHARRTGTVILPNTQALLELEGCVVEHFHG